MRRMLAALLLFLLLTLGAAEAEGFLDDLMDGDSFVPEDNWLVIDADVTLATRYCHPASFDAPAGYLRSAFTDYDDGVTQSFYYVAEDPAAPVSILYVDAVAECTAADYIQRNLDYMTADYLNAGDTAAPCEAFTATVASREARCLYVVYTTEMGSYGSLICAFDVADGMCVFALLGGAYTTAEGVQTAEQLLQEAETLLAGLTIIG